MLFDRTVLLNNTLYLQVKCSVLYNSYKCGTEGSTSSIHGVAWSRFWTLHAPPGKNKHWVFWATLRHIERAGDSGKHCCNASGGRRRGQAFQWDSRASKKVGTSGQLVRRGGGSWRPRLSPARYPAFSRTTTALRTKAPSPARTQSTAV
jgi:hypothetical protein